MRMRFARFLGHLSLWLERATDRFTSFGGYAETGLSGCFARPTPLPEALGPPRPGLAHESLAHESAGQGRRLDGSQFVLDSSPLRGLPGCDDAGCCTGRVRNERTIRSCRGRPWSERVAPCTRDEPPEGACTSVQPVLSSRRPRPAAAPPIPAPRVPYAPSTIPLTNASYRSFMGSSRSINT